MELAVRMRFGVAMAEKGGRTAIIGTEVREARDEAGLLVHSFTVGFIARVQPFTVGAAVTEISRLMTASAEHEPCTIIDVGTAQGLALHQSGKGAYPSTLHRPHAYQGHGARATLFSAFLQAYTQDRVAFAKDRPHRAELDKALVFFGGSGVKKDGVDLKSEDEALVVALGLSLVWPKHGPAARTFEPKGPADEATT